MSARHWLGVAISSCVLLIVPTLARPALGSETSERDIRVMSFNIRYGLADDGDNSWSHRRALVFETLRKGRYDFIGLQEALPFQVEEILENVAGYGVLSRTRESDPASGESCAVLYLEERWSLDSRRSGTFWLSETPGKPGSKSWDSSLPRIATWGRFRERAGSMAIYIYNTHFDHRGEQARLESAKLLRAHAAKRRPALPIVLMGDLNAGESSSPVQWLTATNRPGPRLADSWRILHPDDAEAGTFNGWQGRSDGPKIDYVLVSEDLQVIEAAILRETHQGRHPSDHEAVTARLRLPRR